MRRAAVFVIKTLMAEKLIQAALRVGVRFVKIEKPDARTLEAHVCSRDIEKLKKLLDEYKIEHSLSVVRSSLVFMRERPALFVSVAVLICILCALSGRVWYIDSGGDARLTAYLRERGVTAGVKRDDVDVNELSKTLMARLPEYSFVSVKLSGVKLTIKPVKAEEAPSVFDIQDARDIVADRDAVILSINAISGTPMVKAGDTVRKGDALISGAEKATPDGETRSVRASGEIIARTWTRDEVLVPLLSREKRYTGRESAQADFVCPIWTKRLYGDNPFSYADADNSKFAICGLFFPVNIVRTEWLEYIYDSVPVDENGAKAVSEALALANARVKAPRGSAESKIYLSSELYGETVVKCVCVIEWISDIGA